MSRAGAYNMAIGLRRRQSSVSLTSLTEGERTATVSILGGAFGHVFDALVSRWVMRSGLVAAETRHRRLSRLDAALVVLRVQHFDGTAIGVELHLLQLRCDEVEALRTDLTELVLEATHMAE